MAVPAVWSEGSITALFRKFLADRIGGKLIHTDHDNKTAIKSSESSEVLSHGTKASFARKFNATSPMIIISPLQVGVDVHADWYDVVTTSRLKGNALVQLSCEIVDGIDDAPDGDAVEVTYSGHCDPLHVPVFDCIRKHSRP